MLIAFAKALEIFCVGMISIGAVAIFMFGIWIMVEEKFLERKYQKIMGFIVGGEFVALFILFWMDSLKLWE